MPLKIKIDFAKEADGDTVLSAELRFVSDTTALSVLTMLVRRINTEMAYETWDGLAHIDHYAEAGLCAAA